jgi:hypothetical protein
MRDKEDPIVMKSKTEMEEAQSIMPYNDMLEPRRPNPRTDKADPMEI